MSSTYTVTESYDMAETSMELIARFDRAENTSSKSSQSNGGDGILARALAAATSVEQAAFTHLTKKVRKKALEVVGPAMLVLTFIEDGLRIPLRWSEQLNFLTVDRGFAHWLAALLLVVFCATQLAGAFFIQSTTSPAASSSPRTPCSPSRSSSRLSTARTRTPTS